MRGRALLLLFACIQFTNMMDYLLLMPLGVEISRVFDVSLARFGLLVSCYSFGAGIGGLFAALFLSRVAKKKLLYIIYAGFFLSTFSCGLANTYQSLLAMRCLTGVFGGLTTPIILSLISDLFPENKRGGAIGIFMLGFAIAGIVGVPFGLQLALHFSWRMPFFAIASMALALWLISLQLLPNQDSNSAIDSMEEISFSKSIKQAPHLLLILCLVSLTIAQMIITPYISPFLIKNTGIHTNDLPFIFGVAGVFTLIAAPVSGKLSDRLGFLPVYSVLDLGVILTTVIFTHAAQLSLVAASSLLAFLFAFTTGRFVVAMSIFTSRVSPKFRTSIFSLNSSIQHLAAGLVSYAGGLLISERAGHIDHYANLGWIALAFSILTSFLFRRVLS